MKFWWVGTPRPGNFGDVLTPKILEYFNIPYERSEDFDAICIGSIAKYAKSSTIVLGSGIISARDNVPATADWRFVRGPHTRNRVLACGGYCPEIYGDPALLLPLLCEESEKKYKVGIVPHYVDYDDVVSFNPDYKVIDLLTNDPIKTAKEITECETIISSSLHGIIAAHAYGIPAAWVKFSNKLKGDDIKFDDHYQSIGLTAELSTIHNPKFTTGSINLTPIIDIFKSLA
jgi:hypothetical protein